MRIVLLQHLCQFRAETNRSNFIVDDKVSIKPFDTIYFTTFHKSLRANGMGQYICNKIKILVTNPFRGKYGHMQQSFCVYQNWIALFFEHSFLSCDVAIDRLLSF